MDYGLIILLEDVFLSALLILTFMDTKRFVISHVQIQDFMQKITPDNVWQFVQEEVLLMTTISDAWMFVL